MHNCRLLQNSFNFFSFSCFSLCLKINSPDHSPNPFYHFYLLFPFPTVAYEQKTCPVTILFSKSSQNTPNGTGSCSSTIYHAYSTQTSYLTSSTSKLASLWSQFYNNAHVYILANEWVAPISTANNSYHIHKGR